MCMVFMICERSIASLRMRVSRSPLPFWAATGSINSDRTSDRAIGRFSILYLRKLRLGWALAARLYFRGHNQEKQEMSAVIKSTESNTTLPNSRRVYIDGTQPGLRVPFREITQSPSRNFDGTLTQNPPVRVYDTSGPWGDS